jgi:3-methyl-2-oxobutanoate hydroxymethyltransferase
MRTTIADIQNLKVRGERIPMVTVYDYTSAQIAERAGIPLLLVGDSLGQVVLGYPSTVPVTIDEMLHHTRAVLRGSAQALVVGDLPFLTYTTPDQAIASAGRFLQDGGTQAVKLEGGVAQVPIVRRLVELGIPVMGHLGHTPQSVNLLGTRVKGKRADSARQLIEDALALQDAGVFALVLELVPAQLAQEITDRLRVPTIGIGAGVHCDGQVLVWHDLLGLYSDFVPRHSRLYATLADTITSALQQFASEVRAGEFPSQEHGSLMEAKELERALRELVEQH